ncbi:hypothetical protein [Arthrobacter sp. StoSoilB13]|uniref:hypothetical protein n=1 Tax=Arthrobacter sp. StoSoilB13 TaxID=2830993 RepID=UPI001CC7B182|nr:hypothetical protein [Arthrobacter sp. StoSoilB13]BCW47985.1 hypothetical protein StoSoilB13_03270 [Arthrobacter sp. StoSoilB13]
MSFKTQEVTYTPSGTRSERRVAKRAASAEAVPTRRRLFRSDDDKMAEQPDRERLRGDWGSRESSSLWGPHRLRPAPHRASTMTFAAAYPFITESGPGP